MSWTTDIKSVRPLFLRATLVSLAACTILFANTGTANAQAIAEGFASVAGLPASGWFIQNNSVPVGSTTYFQGGTTIPSQSGPATSYVAVNFNSTTGANTISNWLVAPNRTLNNGDVFSFFTRTVTPGATQFPDRLQVRLSTNGSSTNVGTGPAGLGDFTTLLLDINPTYATGAAGYPLTYTQFTITIAGLAGPTSGRIAFRYFVEDGGPAGANSDFIGIDTFVYTPAGVAAPAQHVIDFDGNGKTDFAIVRNTGGGPGGQITWMIQSDSGAVSGFAWGIQGDEFVPEDYDGDNKTDIAVWRAGAPFNSFWYILQSNGFILRTEVFGQTGDDPSVVGDYNGDGKADIAVYRSGAASGDPSTWFYRTSLDGPITFVPWGQNGDFPAPGDYDGDGKGDFVIQRNNGGGQARFFMLQTTAGFTSVVFGTPTDIVVPGDYDGDGKTDIATVRGSGGNVHWFVRPSSTGVISGGPSAIFGASATDFPTQGDYDGDGKTDFAIWRPDANPASNFFYILGSTSGLSQSEWGQNGDYPVANFNTH